MPRAAKSVLVGPIMLALLAGAAFSVSVTSANEPDGTAPAAHEVAPADQHEPQIQSASQPVEISPDADTDADGDAASEATPDSKGKFATPTKPAPQTKPPTKTKSKLVAPKKKTAGESESAGVSAADALKMLQEGNDRWVSGKPTAPSTDATRRTQQAEGQTPFVSVLTCADSRIPLERVFDRGIGEIFGVRVAGNIAGDSEIGTLEYGVGHLKTKLLVVMGHTKCGAVAAAASGAKLHGKVAELVGSIQPAVDRAKRANPSADEKEVASLAIKENVWQTVYALLQGSEDIRAAVEAGNLQIVGALYDVATGKVEFLGEHPWQRELLAAAKAKEPATANANEK